MTCPEWLIDTSIFIATVSEINSIIMLRKIKNLIKIGRKYPYNGLMGMAFLVELLMLKMFPKSLFPSMSIIPPVSNYYRLDSEEEFRFRYYVSRIGFADLWR